VRSKLHLSRSKCPCDPESCANDRETLAPPDAFSALADPTRRHLLEQLTGGERTASELAGGLTISQAAVSQHLKLLRETGLVAARRDGRHRYYRLRSEGFAEFREWLAALERFWTARVGSLGGYLNEEGER
jgi:DNA-binding transcriptional ArsR family regulator